MERKGHTCCICLEDLFYVKQLWVRLGLGKMQLEPQCVFGNYLRYRRYCLIMAPIHMEPKGGVQTFGPRHVRFHATWCEGARRGLTAVRRSRTLRVPATPMVPLVTPTTPARRFSGVRRGGRGGGVVRQEPNPGAVRGSQKGRPQTWEAPLLTTMVFPFWPIFIFVAAKG